MSKRLKYLILILPLLDLQTLELHRYCLCCLMLIKNNVGFITNSRSHSFLLTFFQMKRRTNRIKQNLKPVIPVKEKLKVYGRLTFTSHTFTRSITVIPMTNSR